jgi:histone deacetylase 1/2
MFKQLFIPVIDRIMEVFNPGAVVLQCGADSLAADRLGSWALSIRGALCWTARRSTLPRAVS